MADFGTALGAGLAGFGAAMTGGNAATAGMNFLDTANEQKEQAAFASVMLDIKKSGQDPFGPEAAKKILDSGLIGSVGDYTKLLEFAGNSKKSLSEMAGYAEKGAKAETKIGKAGYAAAAGVSPEELNATPTLLQGSFLKLYPGSTREDFKDFMGIYSPLVRQKNGELGPELAAELGQVDPWTEAHNRYSTALDVPNPLENKQGAMGPEQSQPAQQNPMSSQMAQPAVQPAGKIAQESAVYAQELRKRVASGAITQDEAAMMYEAKYGSKKR
ncbi:MAG: hypothetical protein WC455_22385 [Dehalococcoidia bacterium]|jgi:hypothetical protein